MSGVSRDNERYKPRESRFSPFPLRLFPSRLHRSNLAQTIPPATPPSPPSWRWVAGVFDSSYRNKMHGNLIQVTCTVVWKLRRLRFARPPPVRDLAVQPAHIGRKFNPDFSTNVKCLSRTGRGIITLHVVPLIYLNLTNLDLCFTNASN